MEPRFGQPPSGSTRHGLRVADVLLAMLDDPDGLTVTQVAKRMDVSKSVVHRILSALRSRGLVTQGLDGTYGVGPTSYALGVEAFRNNPLPTIAKPVLRRLHLGTLETATLAMRVYDRRVHVDQILAPHPLRMSVELGRAYPLHAGATGKAMLAFAPEPVREAVLTWGLEPITAATKVDRSTLERELEQIRLDRYAISIGERQAGARSTAAPILDARAESIGAITVCGPASRFNANAAQRARHAVREAAEFISGHLLRGKENVVP